MGPIASKQSSVANSSIVQTMQQNIKDSCIATNKTVQNAACHIKVDHCNKNVINCGNVSGTTFDCNLEEVANLAANAVATADASTQGAIAGIMNKNNSTSNVDVRDATSQYISNVCANANSTNQNVVGTFDCENSDSDTINIFNASNGYTGCALSTMISAVAQAQAEAKASTKGTNMIIIIVIVVLVLLIIIGVCVGIYLAKKKAATSPKKAPTYTSASTAPAAGAPGAPAAAAPAAAVPSKTQSGTTIVSTPVGTTVTSTSTAAKAAGGRRYHRWLTSPSWPAGQY